VSKSKIILLENFLSLDLINKIKKKYIILPNNKSNPAEDILMLVMPVMLNN
jgi:hypothetical protein